MTVKNAPLGKILESLAANWSLELEIDDDALQGAGISLDQLISFQVEGVSVDELFEEVARTARLTYDRQQSVVKIGAKR